MRIFSLESEAEGATLGFVVSTLAARVFLFANYAIVDRFVQNSNLDFIHNARLYLLGWQLSLPRYWTN